MNNNVINFVFGSVKKAQNAFDHLPIHVFMTFPFLIIYFFIARQLFGLHFIFVIFLIIMLFLMRYSIEAIAFVFFFLAILVYVIGPDVESNYYMSFVYGFLVLSVLKYAYIIITKRFLENRK